MKEQAVCADWHAIDAQEALKRLDVSEEGLSEAQAGRPGPGRGVRNRHADPDRTYRGGGPQKEGGV